MVKSHFCNIWTTGQIISGQNKKKPILLTVWRPHICYISLFQLCSSYRTCTIFKSNATFFLNGCLIYSNGNNTHFPTAQPHMFSIFESFGTSHVDLYSETELWSALCLKLWNHLFGCSKAKTTDLQSLTACVSPGLDMTDGWTQGGYCGVGSESDKPE